jgi:hypothetical protein
MKQCKIVFQYLIPEGLNHGNRILYIVFLAYAPGIPKVRYLCV